MALNINGRMKVKTLKSDFKKEFGLNIRIYDGREFANEDATLASVRKSDSIGGEFSPARNTKVGNLEDKFMELFGIKTQISGSDDSYLCENDHTLAKALEVDKNLMMKRANRTEKIIKEATIEQDKSTSNTKNYDKLLLKAASENNVELAQECLNNGADIGTKADADTDYEFTNIYRSHGYTPLMIVAWSNNEEVAEFLLENGAGETITHNMDIRTGDNAIDIARENGYEDLANLIASYW